MKIRLLCLSLLVLLLPRGVSSQTKTGQAVFAKWLTWQKVFNDQSLASLQSDPSFERTLVQRFYKNEQILKSVKPLLAHVLCRQDLGHEDKKCELTKQERQNASQFYAWLDHDNARVVSYLQGSHFINAQVNQEEQSADINVALNKYKKLLSLIIGHPNKEVRREMLFGVANRFFEYCFSDATFHDFNKILGDKIQHQIGRFFYSTMWYHLVGEGWKHWHHDCLTRLAQDAKQGKEIVYIAGGNDIYQLLSYGIYNICVIDPMLPSQPDYYAEGWEWLVDGPGKTHGVGDVLTIDLADKKLEMRRSKHHVVGTLSAKLSTGDTVQLPKSVTEWKVFDVSVKKPKQLGSVVFQRRFCNQDDFIKQPKKSLLLSFNEMYFVAMPESMGGWGIDTQKFDPALNLYIKQLRKPVQRAQLENVRKGEESPLTFILLGSCPT